MVVAIELVNKMWQHKEFIHLICIIVFISVLGIITGYYISPIAALLIAITTSLIIFITLYYTKKRYSEIKRLSHYLRQISSGDDSLDIRDNHEGELSILKSEIYKVTTMLAEQRSLLQKDKIHLTNAISDISHQLKTPLTSMSMMVELLQSSTLPMKKRMEFTKTIRTQLERIEWLVSALLKLSKIDAGTAQFQREAILVRDLVDKAIETVLIPLDIKEQKVIIDGDPQAIVHADINWTSEALINIFRNAVSHTPELGELHIKFSQNPLFTEIMIRDSGPGIPKEDLPHIFKRFYRGKYAAKDSVGIGLAMAYSIIKKQDGDINVTSSQKEGTIFTLKFYHLKSS